MDEYFHLLLGDAACCLSVDEESFVGICTQIVWDNESFLLADYPPLEESFVEILPHVRRDNESLHLLLADADS